MQPNDAYYEVLLVPKLMTIYKQMKTIIGRFYFVGHFWKAVLFCWALFGRRFILLGAFLKAVLFCCMLFEGQCISLKHIAMVGYLVYIAFWKRGYFVSLDAL